MQCIVSLSPLTGEERDKQKSRKWKPKYEGKSKKNMTKNENRTNLWLNNMLLAWKTW